MNAVKTLVSNRSHCCKWISQYATCAKTVSSSNCCNVMAVDFLVNSLGFCKQEALVASSKLTSLKSIENPNNVIHCFSTIGLSQTQIKTLVSKDPRILCSDVEKTLKPKIRAFEEMGFTKSDLAHILTLKPDVLKRSVISIVHTIEKLRSLLGDKNDDNKTVVTAVKRSVWLLGTCAEKRAPAVISLLQSYGLSVDQIRAFSLSKGRFLSLGTKALEPVLVRVEKLGIPRGSPMFFHGICALCSLTEANLELRMGVYKSYGFTDEDVLTLARRNPYALAVSDLKLRTCLDFFIKEVGYKPPQIAMIPHVLTYSLTKRVVPRYAVWKGLKEKGLLKETKKKLKNPYISLVACLNINEPKFFEKFVLPFKDQCPDVYRDYLKQARPVLEATK